MTNPIIEHSDYYRMLHAYIKREYGDYVLRFSYIPDWSTGRPINQSIRFEEYSDAAKVGEALYDGGERV